VSDYEAAARQRAIEDERRGYSIAGSSGWITSIDHRHIALPAIESPAVESPTARSSPSRTYFNNNGKVLQGYGCRYDTVFMFEGKLTCILQGSLDKALKANHPVRMLMHHDANLNFGDTKRNLILHSDSYGLAFRCHLRNDEISHHVRALAESKMYSECSIGVEILKCETLRIRDTDVNVIREGRVHEVSFVQTGCVLDTHAVIKDAKDCQPLFKECATKQVLVDSSFEVLMRAMQNLDNALQSQ
jgi:HK97 family phage prohead protease